MLGYLTGTQHAADIIGNMIKIWEGWGESRGNCSAGRPHKRAAVARSVRPLIEKTDPYA